VDCRNAATWWKSPDVAAVSGPYAVTYLVVFTRREGCECVTRQRAANVVRAAKDAANRKLELRKETEASVDQGFGDVGGRQQTVFEQLQRRRLLLGLV
jgi:hypothetical protein